jgi:hypothetical protein
LSGLYNRLAIGRRATKKRQPTVPLPDRLLVHMRRWYDKKIIANTSSSGRALASSQ